jgi:hypothetical protein
MEAEPLLRVTIPIVADNLLDFRKINVSLVTNNNYTMKVIKFIPVILFLFFKRL